MHERVVAIPTPDGQMESFITHPEEDGPIPAVVLYMDFWGVREELFDIARRVGTVGYYCMVPDLYYRQGRVRHAWLQRGRENDLGPPARPRKPAPSPGAPRTAIECDGYRGHRRVAAVLGRRRAGAPRWYWLIRLLHGRTARPVRCRRLP